jgi:hypothetical protein
MSDFLKPVTTVEPRPTDPKTPAYAYVRSFLFMRAAVGLLGLALPFVLVLIDGLAFDGHPFPRGSLSAYYYSGMREVFVGMLSAIAVFLITYKITEANLDNAFSILAGLGAVGVALFPTGAPANAELTPLQEWWGESLVKGIHYWATGQFIVSAAVISVFFGVRERARAPHGKLPPVFWWGFHWVCAAAIALAVLWIAGTAILGGPRYSVLIGEVVAVLAFGISWLMKGAELDILLGR